MTPQLHVHQAPLAGPDVVWQFDTSAPKWEPTVDGRRRGGCGTTLDPFPAYPHDPATLTAAVALVAAACPPRWDVHFYNCDREQVGRTNAYSTLDAGGHYEDSGWVKDNPTGIVFLAGKRIQPHPAMTRHLAAHEYGHHVEWMLQEARGEQTYSDHLIREYAAVRGLPDESLHHGAGGTWHDSAHEVFACDFRIVVCDVEYGYWPHPGVPHPASSGIGGATLGRWWDEHLTLLQAPADAAA